ncbi:S-layer homology domain-containing protein [Cohnella hashimotonis]|uniref:S-layer homology domain-containing protein n=1 Tax=Cohnella hashimotonis TaxID=2826895 RepID=A0ABT6TQY5_9BACL|nr:S-layer homology domain-containing protein [Cohnella hashimotonis]MDI4649190.1 S-layer homology domain-containing protein [Cohnella hashimotonis]
MRARLFCILVLLLAAGSSTASQAYAAKPQPFLSPIEQGWAFWNGSVPKDLSGHWSERLFQWGLRYRFITGYPDGSYRPDRPMAEAEFLLMLYRSYGATPLPSVISGEKWSDSPYRLAEMWNQPARGLEDETARTAPMKRVTAAEILTAALGLHYDGENAIRYLLGNRLASGKTAPTVQGFRGEDTVTRAEALQWIRNLKLSGAARISVRPQAESDPGLIPPLPAAGEGLRDFLMIPGTLQDLSLLDKTGRAFPPGTAKSAIDAALGEPDDKDIMGRHMYGQLGIFYDSSYRMSGWSVFLDTLDEDAPYLTDKGIIAGGSTLRDVLLAYGTAGYGNGGNAGYFYELIDGTLVPRMGISDIKNPDRAYVVSFGTTDNGIVRSIYVTTYKVAFPPV